MTAPARRQEGPANRVGRGVGMVTPIEKMQLGGSGSLDVAHPGRDRFEPAHPFVVARPSAFRPCDPSDSSTRSELRELVSRSSSGPRRRTTRPTSATSYGLGPARRRAHVPTWGL